MNITDEQLEMLSVLIYNEKQRRAREKIKQGFFPSLLDEEKELAKGKRVEAIKIYRNRTQHTLMVSKMVVEEYLDSADAVI